jgi:hypothetical protein
MPAPLLAHFDGRYPIFAHDHVAVFYRGQSAAPRMAPFISEGLKRGDLCHFLAPATLHAEILTSIRAARLDPEPYLHSQSLRLREGFPDLTELCRNTQQTFADAERASAPALRWVEEGCWAQRAGFSAESFFETHVLMNYQVKHYPSTALCHYSLDRIEPEWLFPALASHRHLLIEDALVRDHPFYIPAEKFIPLSSNDRRRSLTGLFREVGFDVSKLLAAIAGYGRIHSDTSGPS